MNYTSEGMADFNWTISSEPTGTYPNNTNNIFYAKPPHPLETDGYEVGVSQIVFPQTSEVYGDTNSELTISYLTANNERVVNNFPLNAKGKWHTLDWWLGNKWLPEARLSFRIGNTSYMNRSIRDLLKPSSIVGSFFF